MKRQNGPSPAELVWGRTQPHRLPIHQPTSPTNDGPTRKDDLHKKQIQSRNQHTTSYLPLQPGDTVLLADGTTSKWTKEVTILTTNPSGRSYQVQDSWGHTYTRSREKKNQTPNSRNATYLQTVQGDRSYQNCNYAEVRELDACWRIKERNLMKWHLRERIQLLSRQRDKS